MTEHTRDQPDGHQRDQGNSHTDHTHQDEPLDDAALLWDEMYRSRPRVWSGKPNPQLVREASGLTPGHALDLGCGEGADAIWLAQQGWTVTAVDVSAVALERAAAHAAESEHGHGNRISWEQRDLAAWQPEAEFDLVSVQFLHSPALPWQESLKAAASAVRAGGTLLIAGHHPDGLPPWGTHTSADMFYTPEQLSAELRLAPPEWQIEVLTTRDRLATGQDGRQATLADTVLRAVREGSWL